MVLVVSAAIVDGLDKIDLGTSATNNGSAITMLLHLQQQLLHNYKF